MQEMSGFIAKRGVLHVLDGILHSTVKSAVDLYLSLLRELCMVIKQRILHFVSDILRDTVRTFHQVKSKLDSTLETVQNHDRNRHRIQDI